MIGVHVGIVETKKGALAAQLQTATSTARSQFSTAWDLTGIVTNTKMTQVLAAHIAKRVQKNANTPKPFKGYQGRTVRTGKDGVARLQFKAVSPRYPAKGGTVAKKSGARFFQSSRDFHNAQGTKAGSFNVSGGMWSGLKVRVFSNATRIQFMGRSEGQGMHRGQHHQEPHFRRRKLRKRKKDTGTRWGNVEAFPRKVSNALKAATVYKSTGINVLEPYVSEVLAVSEAIEAGAKLRIVAIGGHSVNWGTHKLRSRLSRGLFNAIMEAA